MKKLWIWLKLLTKRQYKYRSFLCLLLLIPALVFGYSALAQGQSGAVTIALAYDTQDSLAKSICHKLQEESMLIRFVVCDTQQAENAVKSGKADAAWIFPADTQAALREFVKGEYTPFIRVVEHQQSTSLLLCREKLSAAVFTVSAELHYETYLRDNIPALKHATTEALMEHYRGIMMAGELFRFEDITGAAERLEDQQSYLLSPLRGLLGVLAAVCAMASAMHYCRDMEQGVFSWVREDRRIFVELAGQLISLLGVLAVSALCLAFAGLAASLWNELLLLAVYSLCCAGFGMLLRLIFGNRKGLATAMPLVSTAMLAMCPVFFQLDALRYLALLLPPTYYINGTYSSWYLLGCIVYGGVCSLLYFLIKAMKKGVS